MNYETFFKAAIENGMHVAMVSKETDSVAGWCITRSISWMHLGPKGAIRFHFTSWTMPS